MGKHLSGARRLEEETHKDLDLSPAIFSIADEYIIAISGQSVPILRCVKYCALRGRSGYIFTSPILRDRTRMPVLI